MGKRAGEGALIIFLALSVFAARVVAPTEAEVEAMYTAAANDVAAGQYHDALKKLDALDARQPDIAAADNLRGVALMRLHEFIQAESALHRARELDPDFWEARFNLAEVPFMEKNWTEARERYAKLYDAPNESLEPAAINLIEFKILLTYIFEGKERLGSRLMEKFQADQSSPAFYFARAAQALQQHKKEEAKAWMTKAAGQFSPELNALYAESFYEIGLLDKPADAAPVSLQLESSRDRIARAQADLGKADRAYRRGDLPAAESLLDQVDAAEPNQAVSYNLRGQILLDEGKFDEAEKALQSALAADPQLATARYNLARLPFARKDYENARRQWEALLGATAGNRDEAERQQLIRYQIYLTLLLQGRDSTAQKALEDFRMNEGTPALFYAQAAWAMAHGNLRQANDWVANARNLYSSALNRAFAAPFVDLGWLPRGGTTAQLMVRNESSPEPAATVTATAAPVAPDTVVAPPERISPTPAEKTPVPKASARPKPAEIPSPVPTATPTPTTPPKATSTATPSATATPAATATVTPTPKQTASPARTAKITPAPTASETPTPEPAKTPTPAAEETPAPKKKEKPARKKTESPTPTATPRKTSAVKKSPNEEESAEPTPKEKVSKRKKARPASEDETPRKKHSASAKKSSSASPTPTPPILPTVPVEIRAPRQSIGEKVSRFFLYPFRHRISPSPTPSPAAAARPSASPTPARPSRN